MKPTISILATGETEKEEALAKRLSCPLSRSPAISSDFCLEYARAGYSYANAPQGHQALFTWISARAKRPTAAVRGKDDALHWPGLWA